MCFLTFAFCVSMEHCKLYHILMPWKSEKSESLLLKGNLKLQIFCPINRKYTLTWLLLTWKSTLGLYDNGTSLASSNKAIMYLSSPIDNCKPIVHISSNSIWWSVTLTNRNKTPAQEEVMQGASAVAEPPGCVKKILYWRKVHFTKNWFLANTRTRAVILTLSNFKTCQSVGILMKSVIHALIVHLKPPSKFLSWWESASCYLRTEVHCIFVVNQ